MLRALRHLLHNRKVLIGIVFAVFALSIYFVFFHSLTFSPVAEVKQMQQLEQAKRLYPLTLFVSDGCSGNVSQNWKIVVEQLSDTSQSFAQTYKGAENIPFEYACVEHDKVYHAGNGGYTGRLQADLQLRSEIISYGIENASVIQARTQLDTPEEAIFLYEKLAEAIYRGVRLGGAPCTNEPYAWGYGYNAGNCEE